MKIIIQEVNENIVIAKDIEEMEAKFAKRCGLKIVSEDYDIDKDENQEENEE